MRCLPYCKGTILKAIHNCKRFFSFSARVFTVLQRYDFESNSQHHPIGIMAHTRCLPYCKGTILKAIHNSLHLETKVLWVFTVLQRYDFESNSQPLPPEIRAVYGCLPYCKGTILKAIHNSLHLETKVLWVFTVLQRYDFESNSQPLPPEIRAVYGCLPYCKGTILKAIHNSLHLETKVLWVFTVLQRYDFESNSQHGALYLLCWRRCLPYCKGTILKAIHNCYRKMVRQYLVFTVLQRYDFESNSQHVGI